MKVILIALTLALFACNYDKSKNGLILVDPNTGREYLLKHNIGDNYFIYEKQIIIIGRDTTYAYSR